MRRCPELGRRAEVGGWRSLRSLPASTAKLLHEWRLACPKSAARELVFPTAAGHYQHPANLQNRIWVPLQLAIGLKDAIIDPETQCQGVDEEGSPRWIHRYTLY